MGITLALIAALLVLLIVFSFFFNVCCIGNNIGAGLCAGRLGLLYAPGKTPFSGSEGLSARKIAVTEFIGWKICLLGGAAFDSGMVSLDLPLTYCALGFAAISCIVLRSPPRKTEAIYSCCGYDLRVSRRAVRNAERLANENRLGHCVHPHRYAV
ncbi:MAG: hypothetical protein JNG88_02070 [Phycisphaerales bacterium]|nr:hypothetical protein [Phycisphaerales bacterium]